MQITPLFLSALLIHIPSHIFCSIHPFLPPSSPFIHPSLTESMELVFRLYIIVFLSSVIILEASVADLLSGSHLVWRSQKPPLWLIIRHTVINSLYIHCLHAWQRSDSDGGGESINYSRSYLSFWSFITFFVSSLCAIRSLDFWFWNKRRKTKILSTKNILHSQSNTKSQYPPLQNTKLGLFSNVFSKSEPWVKNRLWDPFSDICYRVRNAMNGIYNDRQCLDQLGTFIMLKWHI